MFMMRSLVLVCLLSYSQILVTTACSNPSANDGDFQNIDELRQQILDAHNYYRCLHGLGEHSLKLSSKLNTYAQGVAEDIAKKGWLEESAGQSGENLYASFGSMITGLTATKTWYDEIKKYDYNNPGFTVGTGEFTQVVWKSSTELGCGYAKNSANQWDYIACSYSPPRNYNIAKVFENNVPPLL